VDVNLVLSYDVRTMTVIQRYMINGDDDRLLSVGLYSNGPDTAREQECVQDIRIHVTVRSSFEVLLQCLLHFVQIICLHSDYRLPGRLLDLLHLSPGALVVDEID